MSTSQLCPFVELTGGIYKQLGGYHLIRKDLQFAETALERLKTIHESHHDDVVESCLWHSAVVAYCKCFATGEGRGVSLNRPAVFRGASETIVSAHELMLEGRNQYIAHAGTAGYENTSTLLALSPDINQKELLGLYHTMNVVVAIAGDKLAAAIRLIQYVQAHVEKALDKLFPAVLSRVKATELDKWYSSAQFPSKPIEEKANRLGPVHIR